MDAPMLFVVIPTAKVEFQMLPAPVGVRVSNRPPKTHKRIQRLSDITVEKVLALTPYSLIWYRDACVQNCDCFQHWSCVSQFISSRNEGRILTVQPVIREAYCELRLPNSKWWHDAALCTGTRGMCSTPGTTQTIPAKLFSAGGVLEVRTRLISGLREASADEIAGQLYE